MNQLDRQLRRHQHKYHTSIMEETSNIIELLLITKNNSHPRLDPRLGSNQAYALSETKAEADALLRRTDSYPRS